MSFKSRKSWKKTGEHNHREIILLQSSCFITEAAESSVTLSLHQIIIEKKEKHHCVKRAITTVHSACHQTEGTEFDGAVSLHAAWRHILQTLLYTCARHQRCGEIRRFRKTTCRRGKQWAFQWIFWFANIIPINQNDQIFLPIQLQN